MNPNAFPPFRFLVLTEQWRAGHRRFTFPFAPADKDTALDQAKRKADEAPGRNIIVLERLESAPFGRYVEEERHYPRGDGRFLPAPPVVEEAASEEEATAPAGDDEPPADME